MSKNFFKNIFIKILSKILRLFGIVIFDKQKYLNSTYDRYDLNLSNILKFLKINLNENIIIFDVGAHHGKTLIEYQNIFEDAYIHSFESDPKIFKILENNIKQYNYKNVFLHNIALGELEETKEFYVTEDPQLSGFIKPSYPEDSAFENKLLLTERHKTIAGDNFCNSQNITSIDILHLDVQGFELAVLKGFTELLIQKKISIIVTEFDYTKRYEKKLSIGQFENFFSGLGYSLFDIILLRKNQIYRKSISSDPFKIKLTIGTAIFIKDEMIDNLVF